MHVLPLDQHVLQSFFLCLQPPYRRFLCLQPVLQRLTVSLRAISSSSSLLDQASPLQPLKQTVFLVPVLEPRTELALGLGETLAERVLVREGCGEGGEEEV